ncbi:MAG: hypothetical protein ACI88C_001932 [Acidimicrobiales bacterium]|jgi:hypothetical protein
MTMGSVLVAATQQATQQDPEEGGAEAKGVVPKPVSRRRLLILRVWMILMVSCSVQGAVRSV